MPKGINKWNEHIAHIIIARLINPTTQPISPSGVPSFPLKLSVNIQDKPNNTIAATAK